MTKKNTTSKESPVEEAQVIEFEEEKQLSTIPENSMVQKSITPMDLIAQASASGASIEKMEQLFNLQLRFEENEAKKAYHAAVAAFKSESIQILKDKKVEFGQTSYSHATLGGMVKVIVPKLSQHGLSHSWSMDQEGTNITVTCRLSHELGHFTEVTLSAGRDDSGKKNQIQQVASTVTYLQRYTLLAVTGLSSEDQDDDGVCSEPPAEDVITEQQGMDIVEKIEAAGETEERFCRYFKIANVWLLPVQKLEHATATLDKKIDAKEEQK